MTPEGLCKGCGKRALLVHGLVTGDIPEGKWHEFLKWEQKRVDSERRRAPVCDGGSKLDEASGLAPVSSVERKRSRSVSRARGGDVGRTSPAGGVAASGSSQVEPGASSTAARLESVAESLSPANAWVLRRSLRRRP